MPRVVVLNSGPPVNFRARANAFTRGMRELGYVDGKNVHLEWESANGQEDLLKELSARIARDHPDVILSGSTVTTRALLAAKARAPIVMGQAEDPVLEGFVRSMTHPGGNVTGMSGSVLDQVRRQMELLAEVSPRLRRITALLNPTNTIYKTYRARIEFSMPPGMRLAVVDAATPKEIERAFVRSRDDTEGVIVMNDPLFFGERRSIAEQATAVRRPAVYPLRGYVEAGGLMSWGPNWEANFLRAASYVDRILKGAKPADLPIEPPARFELAANRDTARLLGITIPPEILRQASIIGA